MQYERCENGLLIAALAAELWPERWCWKGAEKQVEKGAKEKRRRERRETQRVAFSSSRPHERPLPRTSAHPRPTTHATSPPSTLVENSEETFARIRPITPMSLCTRNYDESCSLLYRICNSVHSHSRMISWGFPWRGVRGANGDRVITSRKSH